MISKKSLVSVVLALMLSINFGIAANASSVSSSNTNVVLEKNQKEFTVNLSVNNDGKPYSGAEFGIKLNDVELVSTNFSVSNYSQAGPVTKDGVTYLGFFNTDNVYSEGKVCTLTLKYTGDTKASLVLAETQVSTRVNSNNVTGEKNNPNTEITVTRGNSNGGSDNGNNPGGSNGSGGTSGGSGGSGNSGNPSSSGEFVASGNISNESNTGNGQASGNSSNSGNINTSGNNSSTSGSSSSAASNTSDSSNGSSLQSGSSSENNSNNSSSTNGNTTDSSSKENTSQKSKNQSNNTTNSNISAWQTAVAFLSIMLAAFGGIIIWQYRIIMKLKKKD